MVESVLAILDSRSFGSVWFWLLLALVWPAAGRRIAGVPFDVVQALRGVGPEDRDHPAALQLLDWLSLTLPRWRMSQAEGALLLFLATFLLTALFLLGFCYGLEMAQALVLLILPFALLLPAELRLARRLTVLVDAAARGELPANEAARRAARLMHLYRSVAQLLFLAVMAVIIWRGAQWFATHPLGF